MFGPKPLLSLHSPKKRSVKFWIFFWLFALLFLLSWWIFWQYRTQGIGRIFEIFRPTIFVLPIEKQRQQEAQAIFDTISWITDGQERTFLVLFQNNRELRPGGGYIGTFGIVKIKGDNIITVDIHDSNVFDSRIETKHEPPYPMGKLLNIKDWELRDSNWSPDFPTNAQKAEFFYHLEGGEEKIDGIVAISTEVLVSFIKAVGSITIEGYPGEYNAENIIDKLQYQVEKGYAQQGIEEGKRKYIMKDLAKEIAKRIQEMSWIEKRNLLLKLEEHLNEKDIMVFFQEKILQNKINQIGWGGELKETKSDFLMMVDANLSALKTDRVIDREFNYEVDLSQERPLAKLSITYINKGVIRDWQTTDYQSFLRVYVPEGAWLEKSTGFSEEMIFDKENGKKYFGSIVRVPLGETKKVEFIYYLPKEIIEENYELMIQKQSGIKKLKGIVKVKNLNKEEKIFSVEEGKAIVKIILGNK